MISSVGDTLKPRKSAPAVMKGFHVEPGAMPTPGSSVTSWYRIGGVERDLTPSLIDKLKQFLDYFPPKIDEHPVALAIRARSPKSCVTSLM